MKQLSPALIILALLPVQALAQTGSETVYKNLETKKFYSVNTSAVVTNGKGVYEVNGKQVSKAVYDKYSRVNAGIRDCCPCIYQSHDIKDVLLWEAVACTDCRVGFYNEFYPGGKVKISGHYKENPTGNWDNIFGRGYCNVKDGQWTYFDEKGDTLYAEWWKNGDFVKQVPEQEKNEVWKAELTLDGKPVGKKRLSPAQVKQLVVTPGYKNNSVIDTAITIQFEVTAISYRQIQKTFTRDNFNTIDVTAMLAQEGIPSKAHVNFILRVYQGGRNIENFYLDVQH